MTRTLVIGDIHGGLKALKQVLKRAKVTTNDILIFLGDYVDGWSESPQVIDFLIKLNYKQKCVFIRGNHDELVLDWLEHNNKNIDEGMWYIHGGKATVDAYQNVSNETKNLHIRFFKSLHNHFLDSKNRLFVHAGFTNMHGVDYEYFPKMLYWDRTLWETAVALDEKLEKDNILYPKRFTIYNEVYIGHTPTIRIGQNIPINKACVWNIDTGAGFDGKLTILDVDTKEYWQSDALPDLYPDEKGRN
jgi:serine/threonine protein phosphatase 1